MLQFDAEASRRVEATYTTPDVVEQRQKGHCCIRGYRVEAATLLVERPERGGDDGLDVGEGGHRMQQRRTSLGGTVASGDHSNRRPPPESLNAISDAKIDSFEHFWQLSGREAAPLATRQPHLRARYNSAPTGTSPVGAAAGPQLSWGIA
jgi:hypothetical protein